jgi:hypothetical protein
MEEWAEWMAASEALKPDAIRAEEIRARTKL